MISVLLVYARKLVFPWPLAIAYEVRVPTNVFDTLFAPGMVLLAGWTILAVACRSYAKIVALALTLFILPLLPPLVAAAVTDSPMADRYLYLPAFGFALLCGWFGASPRAARAWASRSIRVMLVMAVVAAAAAAAFRAKDFKDNLTLWSDTAAKSPGSSLARGQYAVALFAAGRYEAGVREALEAIRLDPGNPDNHYNLALASERQGLWQVAANGYRQVIELGNTDAEVLTHLASVLLSMGNAAEAAQHASRAVSRDPANAEARYVLGRALVEAGDYMRGAEELAAAVRLNPDAGVWRRDAEAASRLVEEAASRDNRQ